MVSPFSTTAASTVDAARFLRQDRGRKMGVSRTWRGLAARSVAISVALAVGCVPIETGEPSQDPEAPTESLYVVPAALSELAGDRFFDHPWPSDLRLEEGSPRFEGWPNPLGSPLLDEYAASMRSVLNGFSPAAAGFLRFAGSIDPASLPPTPLAGTDPSASVQLVDIDPGSPERGQRRLVSLKWREEAGVYWPPTTLAFMPTLGFPLRPRTRYALVVTDAVRAPGGGEVTPSQDLREALGIEPAREPRTEAARAALAPAVGELEAAGVPRDRIVHLAVFTTTDPAAELFAYRDHLRSTVPAPTARIEAWKLEEQTEDFEEYQGVYGPSPNYQAGAIPFASYGDGGQFHVDGGAPAVFDWFDLRFSLTVPNAKRCPMPEAGYPIVLYAHGTGGSFRSYLKDGTGRDLALRCVATMGVDQIFHGKRPGAPAPGSGASVELLFYNFQNPVAARTNGRQSALDEVQRARLFTETKMVVPASVSATGADIRFDASRVMFFGHSQGGLNGPLFFAADDAAIGGVFSGAGAVLAISLLAKTKPEPAVSALVKSLFLGLKPAEYSEVDVFHPAIALAQSIVDVTDPIHYAPYIAMSPRAGMASKSVYMTEGVNPDGVGDSYAPPRGIEAHGVAMGLPLVLPAQRPIPETEWGGPKPVSLPPEGLRGNLAGGEASGALAQWPVPPGHDGHYVVFDVPEARTQAGLFLRTLADDAVGSVLPP